MSNPSSERPKYEALKIGAQTYSQPEKDRKKASADYTCFILKSIAILKR